MIGLSDMKFVFFSFMSLFSLVSCTTQAVYKDPQKSIPYASIKADSQGNTYYGVIPNVSAIISQINNKSTNSFWKTPSVSRRLTPGKNTILLQASIDKTTTALGELTFNAKENKMYLAGAKGKGENYMFYVKDEESGKILVSKMKPKTFIQPTTSYYTPIFIPVN